MQKPNNFDETQAGGDFTPVTLGAHYGVIKNVMERTTKNGDPMIVVSIDFDKKDEQAGYFMDAFRNDTRPDKKYPNQANNYITTEYMGKCTRGFKSFIKAYADSNKLKEDDIKWGSDFATQFKNKKIGVVFGNVEELYNGEQKMRRKIRWFCDYAKVPDQRIPEDKLLDAQSTQNMQRTSSAGAPPASAFVNVPEGVDDEIPFD